MTESLKYRRRDGIAWREEPEAAREAFAALEAGRDAGGEGTLLLVDRGRVHELNFLGAEIWKLLDGARDEAGIVEALLPRFDVERAELEGDVREFLEDLAGRGWVVRS
jgi:GeoRSP system PqqD family protein